MPEPMSSTDDRSTGSLQTAPDAESPFAHPDRAAFEAHLARSSYGRFTLTERAANEKPASGETTLFELSELGAAAERP